MSIRLPYHALRAHRMMRARYWHHQPVVGAIPYELQLHERYWEKRFHLDTGGWVDINFKDGMLYEATPYLLLNDILTHLHLGPQDVFVDLGCGKGRVTCMAARTEVGLVVGIEQDPAFLQQAKQNLSRIPDRKAEVQWHHGLAQDFDFHQSTIVYMFNPFGAETLQKVVDQLEETLHRNPRTIRIVYANPVHQEVLTKTPWLQTTQSWPCAAYAEFTIQPPNPTLVSFWKSK